LLFGWRDKQAVTVNIMSLTLPLNIPVMRTLVFDPPLTDEELVTMCADTVARIERTKEGKIEVKAPKGLRSSSCNVEINVQLSSWWMQHRIGKALGTHVGFYLADGSMLSPDAAWISPERLAGLTAKERQGFPYLCPDFVIELLPPSDSLETLQAKMGLWIANGALLAWLIDPDSKRVLVYRPNAAVREHFGSPLHGDVPIAGFILDLEPLWDCYLD
jgi:Uma2 family endonuclease